MLSSLNRRRGTNIRHPLGTSLKRVQKRTEATSRNNYLLLLPSSSWLTHQRRCIGSCRPERIFRRRSCGFWREQSRSTCCLRKRIQRRRNITRYAVEEPACQSYGHSYIVFLKMYTPLVQKQWETLVPLRAQVVHKATASMRDLKRILKPGQEQDRIVSAFSFVEVESLD